MIGNTIRLSHIFKWHVVKFRFKVSTDGKHFSYLFFWPKVIDIEMHLTIYMHLNWCFGKGFFHMHF